MNENFKKVSADTTLEELSQWLEEGRLYVAPSSNELTDRAVGEILARVAKIDECCSAGYAEYIGEVWLKVCKSKAIRRRLVMNNGKHKNSPNWYYVANIVSMMLGRGVYNKTLRGLTMLMHGGKTSIANNAMQPSYMLSDEEYGEIKDILSSFFNA